MPFSPPTDSSQVLPLVTQRVPQFHPTKKTAVATAAVGILNEPRHQGKAWMHGVKIAVARTYRRPADPSTVKGT